MNFKIKKNNNIALIMPGLGYVGAERVAVSLCNWIINNTDNNVTILSFDTKNQCMN